MRLSRSSAKTNGTRANPAAKPRPPGPSRPVRRGQARKAGFRARWGRWLGFGLLPAIVVGAGAVVWQSGVLDRAAAAVSEATLRFSADAGLEVRNVLVEGRGQTSSAALVELLAIERGMPILAVDPEDARARLEDLPWVAEVAVERRLPDTVFVRLTERRALALWQNGGEIAVIDGEGRVIPGVHPGRFAKLLLVVGEDAAPHAAALLAMLTGEPDLADKVTAAIRVGGRRWNLRLDGNIDVRLPEEGAPAAWSRFARMVRQEDLLEHDVAVVDLRLPDRLIVRTSRGGVPPLRAQGQET